MNNQVLIHEPGFYCYQDEKHFFEWLESIPGVKSVAGNPQGLSVQIVNAELDQDGWADLIGLMARYDVNMKVLRDLVTPENVVWLKDPERYWYPMIFGDEI